MTKFVLTEGPDLFPAAGVNTGFNDIIEAGEGNDTVDGGAGKDTIYGGIGDDVMYGGTGHDVIFAGNGRDEAWGGSGNDTVVGYYDTDFKALQGGTGTDMLAIVAGDGGPAVTNVTVGVLNKGLQVNLDGRIISANSFEHFYLESATALTFTGGAEIDEIISTAGRSRISTGAGDDMVSVARSVVVKGLGDKLDGGTGFDVLKVDVRSLDSWLNVSFDTAGAGRYSYALGNNSSFVGFEALEILGGQKNDTVMAKGQAVELTFIGAEGNALDRDKVEGGTAGDLLLGGSGADTLRGHEGDDTIIGGTGGDFLAGGAGEDAFVFLAGVGIGLSWSDRIEDFTTFAMTGNIATSDYIELTEAKLAAGLTALTFIGTDAFTGIGQVRVVDLGAELAIEVNLRATVVPEMRIILEGLSDATLVTATDFLL